MSVTSHPVDPNQFQIHPAQTDQGGVFAQSQAPEYAPYPTAQVVESYEQDAALIDQMNLQLAYRVGLDLEALRDYEVSAQTGVN